MAEGAEEPKADTDSCCPAFACYVDRLGEPIRLDNVIEWEGTPHSGKSLEAQNHCPATHFLLCVQSPSARPIFWRSTTASSRFATRRPVSWCSSSAPLTCATFRAAPRLPMRMTLASFWCSVVEPMAVCRSTTSKSLVSSLVSLACLSAAAHALTRHTELVSSHPTQLVRADTTLTSRTFASGGSRASSGWF